MSRGLFKNFILLLGGSFLGQLAFLFGLVHLARVLGPAGFGNWNFAQTWLLYLFRAGELGIEVLAIREISKTPELTSEWMKKSYLLRVLIASILFLLTLGLVFFNLLPQRSTALVIVFSLGVLVWSFTLEWVLEGRQDVVWVSIVRVMKGVLFALPVYFLVHSPNDIVVSAWIYVGSLAVSVFIIALIVIKRYGWSKKRLKSPELRSVLYAAFPMGIATLLSQYSLFFGTIVVGYLLKDSDLGYFTAGHRIVVFIWAYVIVSSNRVVLPTLARYFHASMSDFQSFLRKFFRLIVMVAVPIGLTGTLLSPFLLPVLYSSVYESSVIVFQILIWGLVAAMVRSIFEVAMIASDNQNLYLRVTAVQAVVYTLTTVILTIAAGIVGAAVACLVSEVVVLLYVVVTYPHAQISRQDFWKPLAALIVSVLVVLMLPSGMLMRSIVSLAAYAMAFVAIKGLSSDDIGLLKRILGVGSLEQSTGV